MFRGAMARKTRTDVSRRKFLADVTVAGTTATLLGTPSIGRAQSASGSAPRSARDRIEDALSRSADANGEGARTCLTVYADAAKAAADAADARARAGISLGPLDGAIVTIKDLFDVAGEPTRAGSKVLANAAKATAD